MIIIMIFLALSLVFWSIFGYVCFSNAHMRRKSRIIERNDLCGGGNAPEEAKNAVRESRRWIDDSEYEPIYIDSVEGYRLFGKLIAQDNAKGTVIFAHGYHSTCRRDLAIQVKTAYEGGYNALLIFQRAHGASEGKYICFGARERYDLLAWAEYVSARFPNKPVALFGFSMGAATVMLSSELGLPDSVRCIVADCGFTSPREIIANTLRYRKRIIVYPTIIFMELWCRLLAKFRYGEVSTLDALKKNTRPLLLIHGECDRYVPTEMSIKNAEVTPDATELFIVPDAKHGQAVYFDTDGYKGRMLEFLDKHMVL